MLPRSRPLLTHTSPHITRQRNNNIRHCIAVQQTLRRTFAQSRIITPQSQHNTAPPTLTSQANATTMAKVFTSDTINDRVKNAEYAVRGELVIRAEQLKTGLTKPDHKLPFHKVVQCNIGNPQDLGQKPITFFRQVLSLMQWPDMLENKHVNDIYPSDVIERARHYLDNIHGGVGAYSHSMGVKVVRDEVAAFINARDGSDNATPDNIYLIDGASSGVKTILNSILAKDNDGIMIPIPQYPLYTAALTLFGGNAVKYYLNEDKHWSLNRDELEKSLAEAKKNKINVKAIVVINPGNPTGNVLPYEVMSDIVKFAEEHHILIMADEVYQTNIYEDVPFTSFKKVVNELKSDVELVSFQSTSKGYYGECGQRGGYMELTNLDKGVQAILYKLASISLCSNMSGQIMTGLTCNTPKSGQPSFELFEKERTGILDSLQRRAQVVHKYMSELDGVTCQTAQGAMYAFPNIKLPAKAIEAAKKANKAPDVMYCLELLEATGLCVVPGSGFGQVDGTYHFRTTILPSEEDLEEVLKGLGKFHDSFMKKYK